MNEEMKFLLKALEKERCSVVVMSYLKNETRLHSKMEYITDNVESLGMNLSALKGGYRLPKDYIHPEDRMGFVEALQLALKNHTGFSYGMRICGDDGIIRKVDLISDYLDEDHEKYIVEYVIRETSKVEEIGATEVLCGPNTASDSCNMAEVNQTRELFNDNRMTELFDHIANTFEVYSAVVDLSGKKITEPVGPAAFLGEFYDILERPEYFEVYEKINRGLISGNEPIYLEVKGINPDSRLTATPILIGGRHVADWLLFARDKDEAEKLRKILKHQKKLIDVVTDFVYKLYRLSHKRLDDRKYKELLEFDKGQKKIISDMLKDVTEQRKPDISEYLERAGRLLDIDHIILFKESSKYSEIYSIDDYWSIEGKSPATVAGFDWNSDHFTEDERRIISKEGFVVDHTNMTNHIRIGIFAGKARAVIIRPVVAEGRYYGRLVMIENRKEREWKEAELVFSEQFASLIAFGLNLKMESKGLYGGRDSLYDILNQFSAKIFIRDNKTGKIIFANTALNNLAGHNMTGEDSWSLVPDTKDDILGYEPRSKSKRVNWRKYIPQFSNIFDITMLPVTFQDGETASVFILRLAQD